MTRSIASAAPVIFLTGLCMAQPPAASDEVDGGRRKPGANVAPASMVMGPTMSGPGWAMPPALVVGIVVDQMRTDHIYRYWENFGNGGFRRLITGGAFLRNAHYTYVPTVTGPGHASIYTGSVPAHHGIVANERYDRGSGRMVYCVNDTTVKGVGHAAAQASPRQLFATTLADEIERRTDRRGRTIGVALKDRSSVLPIGRTGDAAYWFSGSTGGFVTSSWYMDEQPRWVQEFNGRKLTERYLQQRWEPLLPLDRYHQVLPDANTYEQPLAPGGGNAFPYDLNALSKGPAGLGLIASTPWGNTITTDMALAALEGEQLGADEATDLLAISYSSTDILGHKMGLRALEMEDMYIRLDQEIARLLDALDNTVGEGRYTLFLTADHGAVDVPQYLKDLKGSAGYVAPEELIAPLRERGSGADPILFIGDGQVFLRRQPAQADTPPATATSMDIRLVLDALMAHPAVHSAYAAEPERTMCRAADEQQELCMNGFMPQRCGDVLYTLKPGYFEAEGSYLGKGTTHGSGWTYDTHVPVLFYGKGIAQVEVVRRTSVADIVPTITMVVGCALPDAAVGDAVPEILR